MIHTVKYKKCTKCLENKKLSQFHNDKYKKLGKKSSCVKCDSERKKISYTLNRSIILERGIEYKKQRLIKKIDIFMIVGIKKNNLKNLKYDK